MSLLTSTKIQLTAKELARACDGFTTCVRPNKEKGGWNVCVVEVSVGLPVFKMMRVEEKDDIGMAIRSDLRWMDKCGIPCRMSFASRHRQREMVGF